MPGDPNFANVVLLMHCEDFHDVISNTDASNGSGAATIDSGTVKFGSGSIKPGAGSLTMPAGSNWDFGTGAFTIEFWANSFGSNANGKIIFGAYQAADKRWALQLTNTNRLQFVWFNGFPYTSNYASGWGTDGTWYAICIERDDAGDLRIYRDGVMRAKTTGFTYDISGTTDPLTIGNWRPTSTSFDAKMYFDEIRITKGVARYASDSGYTVQTAPFPDTGLVPYEDAIGENGIASWEAFYNGLVPQTVDEAATAADDASGTIPLIGILSDAGVVTGGQRVTIGTKIEDAGGLSEVLRVTIGQVIEQYAAMASTMSIHAQYKLALAEAARVSELARAGRPVTIEESATLDWAVGVVQGCTIAEKLKISDLLNRSVKFGMTITQRARVHDALARFLSADVSETITASEAMLALSRHFATINETGDISEELVPRLILKVEAHDDGVFDDAFNISMIYNEEIREQIVFTVAIAMPDGGVTTWAINTITGAVTEYENYEFNSFAQLGVHYLGASEGGLYALDGDDDEGDPIIARLKSGMLQFGGSLYSGIKAAYIGMRSTEGSVVYLKIETKTEGTRVYKGVVQPETTKVRLGKGLRARYYSWELVTTGQDFDLDNIEFLPLVAQRRV